MNDHTDKVKHILGWIAVAVGWLLSKVTEFEVEIRAFILLCTVVVMIFQLVHWWKKTFRKNKRDARDN